MKERASDLNKTGRVSCFTGRLYPLVLFFGLYLVLSIVLTWPTAKHFFTHMPGGRGDPLLTCWYLDWNIQKLLHLDFGNFFSANIFYPHRDTAAYSEPFISTSFLAVPFYFLFEGRIVAVYNGVLILSFALTCLGTHLLVRRLTGGHLPALAAALVFSFAPLRIGHIEHLHLVTAQWIPFTLWAFHGFLKSRSWPAAAMTVFFFLMNCLSSLFYMVALSVTLAVLGAFMLPDMMKDRRMLFRSAVMVLAAAMILAPFLMPYVRAQREFGLKRTLGQNRIYSARLSSYAAVPSWQGKNLVYGRLLKWDRFARPEGVLFPGLTVVILSLAGLLLARRRDGTGMRWRIAYSALALVGLMLSFGPSFSFMGGVGNPVFELFYRGFPGFHGMRTPSRFGVLVLLGLSVLGGYGLSALQRRRSAFRRTVVLSCVPLLLFAEYFSYPIGVEPGPDADGTVPGEYAWLESQTDGEPILEMPSHNFWLNARYVYYSILHRRPMINGYSSYYPPVASYFSGPPQRSLDDDHLTVLEQLGVRYLVIHRRLLGEENLRPTTDRLDALNGSRVRRVAEFGDTSLYELSNRRRMGEWKESNFPIDVHLQMPTKASGRIGSMSGTIEFMSDLSPVIVNGLILAENRKVDIAVRKGGAAVVEEHNAEIAVDPYGAETEYRLSVPVPRQPSHYTAEVSRAGMKVAGFDFTVLGDIPTSAAPSELSADLQVFAVPSHVPAGQRLPIRVLVRNRGDTLWLAHYREASPPGRGEVRVGYRLYEAGKFLRGGRGYLPFDVAPGEEAEVDLEIGLPAEPGEYEVGLDLVDETFRWFHSIDTQPLRFHVTVTAD